MLGVNLSNVDAAGNRVPAGGYVIQIQRVTVRPQKQDLEIEYDIIEGEYAGYYRDLFQRKKFWLGKFYKSYKENALPFLKEFMQTIMECNPNADGLLVGENQDIDETKLPGKYVGLVYGLEEYIGNDGKVKTRPDYFGATFIAPDKIRAGQFDVPEFKPLQNNPAAPASGGVVDTTAGFGQMSDGDMPF